jgi:heme exporter protein A
MQLFVHGLGHSFSQGFLFRQVNLNLNQGQVLGVVGPNGSGKTTLLRIFAGLLRPREGRVFYGSIPAHQGRHLLGFISPHLALYPELTALENLSFIAKLRGMEGSLSRLQRILEEVDLSQEGGERVGAFSAGMTQRLKLASLLVYQPPVLLLDEPGSNLDQNGRQLVARLIKEHQGLTVLATNEPEEVAWADEWIHLDGHGHHLRKRFTY